MLVLLTSGFGLNQLDRQIINILAEPIKRDLALRDWQLGALSGLSFALLYSVAALPIARFADRSNRVRVIGAAILAWSLFTAACGMAGSFIQLLLLRIGVGIGEAGGAPPSQSLIADSYPSERRAGALAVFALGSAIGASVGLIGGGMLAGLIGWRWTLAIAGAPGLVIGALLLLTLRDPQRSAARPELPTLGAALAMLLSRRAFLLMALGSAMLSFVNYGAMAFAGSFYLRNHLAELTAIGEAIGQKPLGVIGLGLGLIGMVGGMLGAIVGGRLGDRMGTRDVRMLALIPAVGSVLCAASYVVMFTLPSAVASLLTFAVASFFSNLWYGPGTLGMQRLAGAKAKATALAVALFVNSAIGLSFGPLLVGLASDALSPRLGAGEGLRAGILIGLSAGLVSALFYWLASRRIGSEVMQAEEQDG
ncbi:MAG: Major facilitator family transporter [Sphingomonas bacterium]|uniref:spinster family MFS transporter n=1 Tax=Sphingomonas bacterium TaxID=1895847 RepID=UPI00261C2293|nr:MFS transporter [Sphingomonas bacterium]MDB5708562.1 Major facilitator family transporter [Sphingomonas bacterium]